MPLTVLLQFLSNVAITEATSPSPCGNARCTCYADKTVPFSRHAHIQLDINNCGAIGSRRAAAEYGLEVLADQIQDANTNVTRFLLLGSEAVADQFLLPLAEQHRVRKSRGNFQYF